LIRVGIVSPGQTLRIGLVEVFRSLPDIQVTAAAASLEGLPVVDVLVLSSADLLADLNEDAPAVLLLTNDPDDVTRLAGFAVWGILPVEASPEELSATVHALAEGLLAGSPALINSLLEQKTVVSMEDAEMVVDLLTEREHQVLQLIAEGLANKQISAALNISENTVKFHVSSLYAKLGVTSRTEAVRSGARRGWVVL
jgi:DNA-binding NarL/FixJ family response regulator